MKAVIQAGGKGTRLHGITKDQIPKPMVEICGKPLLQWQIEKLLENNINDIYIIIGHLGGIIKNYFQDGSSLGARITYIEEEEAMGSAGSLFCLKKYIHGQEDILLVYGDVFFEINIARMHQYHLKSSSMLTAFAHPNSHPEDSDLYETDSSGRIIEFLSKKDKRNMWHANLVNAGFYIMKGHIINSLMELQKMDFEKDILKPLILEQKNVFAYRSTEYIKDAGTEGRLLDIQKNIVSGFMARRNLAQKQKCIFFETADADECIARIDSLAGLIRKINNSEYLVILVSDQPRRKSGIMQQDLEQKQLQTLLGRLGAYFDDIVVCSDDKNLMQPERRTGEESIRQMAGRYNISLKDSWIVCETNKETAALKNAGLRTVPAVVDDLNTQQEVVLAADFMQRDLASAIDYILHSAADNWKGQRNS